MKTQWSLRQMFWWMFVLALILPYLLALVPKRHDPFARFSVSDADLLAWMRELDPTVETCGRGGSWGSRPDEANSECDYRFAIKNTTPDAVLAHLKKRVKEKIEEDLGVIGERGSSSDSFSFAFSKGSSRYRLYVWNVPASKSDRDRAEASGREALQVRVLTIGYTAP